MRLRAAAVIVMIAFVALRAPAAAQDQVTTVAFDGVSFAFGPELGESADVTRVPGQPTDQQEAFVPDAPHLAFTLYGTSQEFGRTPRVGSTDSVVRVYRVADLVGYDGPSRELASLRALLADRGTLASFMVAEDIGAEPLPHLPVDTAAAQALRARATYIDTPELTGIAYVAGYRQDTVPFAAGDFVYTFEALSTDGEWYVSGDFNLEAGMFPQRIRPRDAGSQAERWPAYLEESVGTLNAASPDEFAPRLTAIDDLIDSIAFE